MNRKKMSKLFGKLLDYTATVGKESEEKGSTLLLNVCYKGKEVSDHCWVSTTHALTAFKEGDEITFKGVATTYKCKQQERKNGLERCQSYFLVSDKQAMAIHNHDCQNKKRRLTR